MEYLLSSESATIFLILASIALSFIIYYGLKIISYLPSRVRNISYSIIVTVIAAVLLTVLVDMLAAKEEVCLACHQVNAIAAPHEQLNCHSCHQEEGVSGWMVLRVNELGMLLSARSYQLGERKICLPQSTCLRCHTDIESRIVQLNGVRVRHLDFIKEIGCMQCHEDTVHATAQEQINQMALCFKCHESNSCGSCHLHPVELIDFVRITGLKHTGSWEQTHGFNEPELCRPCHDTVFCQGCHESFPHDENWKAVHGRKAKKDVVSCTACHLIIKCNDCHGIEMPHPSGWQVEHAAKAFNDWKLVCSSCHTRESCLPCHEQRLIDRVVNQR